MKKKFLLLFSVTTFLFLTIFFVGYPLTDDTVKKNWLKYGGGYYLGDKLKLDDANYRNDTIYIDKKPIAIFLTSGILVKNNDQIILKSLDKKLSGTYFLK